MINDDYREILQYARRMMREAGLSGVDQRIMSDLRDSEGPFWDLTFYLKRLAEEVSLGSDVQLASMLHRFRRHVDTESEEAIEGISVTISDEDRERYAVERIDFSPDRELGLVAEKLRILIEELHGEYRRHSDRWGGE